MAQTSPRLFNILIFLVSFDFGARRSPVKRFDFYLVVGQKGMDAVRGCWKRLKAWALGTLSPQNFSLESSPKN